MFYFSYVKQNTSHHAKIVSCYILHVTMSEVIAKFISAAKINSKLFQTNFISHVTTAIESRCHGKKQVFEPPPGIQAARRLSVFAGPTENARPENYGVENDGQFPKEL